MADDHSSPTPTALADSLPSLDQVRYLWPGCCGLDRNRHTGSSVADILLSQSDARLTALLAALAQIRALPQRLDSHSENIADARVRSGLLSQNLCGFSLTRLPTRLALRGSTSLLTILWLFQISLVGLSRGA